MHGMHAVYDAHSGESVAILSSLYAWMALLMDWFSAWRIACAS